MTLKMTPFDTPYDFLLMIRSNYC